MSVTSVLDDDTIPCSIRIASIDIILHISYFVQAGHHPELWNFRYVVSEKMSTITVLSSDPRSKITIFNLNKYVSALL